MKDKQDVTGEDRERAMRMLAIQIVAQLPADGNEANRVLCLARELLNDFLLAQSPAEKRSLRCVT